MAFRTWQVGLDIQNGQLCALGIQRRRNGWQLRHWWQQVLPQDTLTNGLLQRPDAVITVLRQWRKRLPYRISLRVGFPPQLVLQRHLDLPGRQLGEPERSSYIAAAARRFFPIELERLVMDYRQPQENRGQLCVTATRRDALQSWLDCLAGARLTPQVMELTPAGLCAISQALRPQPATALVHRLEDHWLWYAGDLVGQKWGWRSRQEVPDFATLRAQHLPEITTIYYSAIGEDNLPPGTLALNPLEALAQKQPPLPLYAGAFTLAAGLALRPEDA
ncbi:pilus assembly protein PilM [Erwinia sp. P6884]|uniref:pilus assembly protein PilM n=1 Tax=Erwinia sp. P6884 TaxID=3141450 RepID=UPI003184BC72